MSQIDFRKIGAKNFNSFEDFDLTITPGKHLIIGENRSSGSANSNGSGKSSMWEAAVWTLYKKTIRGKDPSRDYKGDCCTTVEFVKDNATFRVERYWKDKQNKNDLKLFKDGEEVSLRKNTSTEEELEKLIGIPYDLFISSVVVLQGLPINFSTLQPTVRKSIVEEMLGFSIWNEYKDKFTGCVKENDLDRQQKEQQFQEARIQMTQLNTRLETLKNAQTQAKDDLEQQIVSIKSQLKVVFEKYDTLTLQKQEKTAEIGAVGNSYTLRQSLTGFQKRINDLKKIVDERICIECGQNYPEVKIKEALGEAEFVSGKIKQLSPMLQTVEEIERGIQGLDQQLYGLQDQKRIFESQMNALFSKLNQQESPPDLDKLGNDLQDCVLTVNGLKTDLNSVMQKISHLQYLNDLMLPSSQFRTFVLEKYINYLNGIIESIVPMIFEEVQMKLVVGPRGSGIELEIKRNDKEIEYKSLSGGERKRLDIAIILAFQRFLIESAGVSTNVIVLDEIFDALDVRGIENVMSCLDGLFPDSSSMYIITHNDSLKSAFGSVLKVVKEGNISKLEHHAQAS